jgi:acetyl-CoA C-acetyltransferase
MNAMREVVVLSGVRTPVGTYGGSLKDFPPTKLAAMVVKDVVERAGLTPVDVDHSVFGHCVLTEPRDAYMGRVAAIEGGLPVETPAFTVNRLCGSGLQAILSGAQLIMHGDADCVVAGGAESLSRGAYISKTHRFGARMGHDQLVDLAVGG